MKTKTPVWLFLLFTLAWSTAFARSQKIGEITPVGGGVYSLTVMANDKFTRNTEKLKARAIEVATQYCTKQGKQFKLVSADEKKSAYLVGDFAQTTITFKALGAGDPELAAAPGEAPHYAPPPPPPAVTADILASELTKLDELRKKGLLTDEEFTAAKKKLLERM